MSIDLIVQIILYITVIIGTISGLFFFFLIYFQSKSKNSKKVYPDNKLFWIAIVCITITISIVIAN